jgi:ketosteroid isomerase-like protein
MKRLASIVTILLMSTAAGLAVGAADDEEAIRGMTQDFCRSIVAKDLSVIDRMFDPSPENIFYDINEGPLSFERVKRVWRAATTNFTISRFEFTDDMNVQIVGDRAVQTGTWEQTQEQKDGGSRDIVGRATILWKKTPDGWRVYHYHASVTPPRPQRR